MVDPNKPSESKPLPSSTTSGSAAPAPSQTAFVWRHRGLLLRLLFLLLIVIFVMQNSEPTTIDVFLWSLPSMPKLVLILSGMALGALVWEIVRRLIGLGGSRRA